MFHLSPIDFTANTAVTIYVPTGIILANDLTLSDWSGTFDIYWTLLHDHTLLWIALLLLIHALADLAADHCASDSTQC
jgi:hypothetical protein